MNVLERSSPPSPIASDAPPVRIGGVCFSVRPLDGAMGTELIARGVPTTESLAACNRTHPDLVRAVHRAYRNAGAQCLSANSFLVHHRGAGAPREPGNVSDSVRAAVALACEEAADEIPVALSLGPGADSPATYGSCARAARDAGAALIVLETFTRVPEAVSALRAAGASDLPVAVLFVFDADGKTLGDGARACDAARALHEAGAAAVGANCQPPNVLRRAVAAIASALPDVSLIARPSAGIPVRTGEGWAYPWPPESWAAATRSLRDEGATLLGGCCGAGPAHIAALARTPTANIGW